MIRSEGQKYTAIQDDYCQRVCRCRCGYYIAREKEYWNVLNIPDTTETRVVDGIIVNGPPS